MVLSRRPILDAQFEAFAVRGLPDHLHHIDFLGGKGVAILRVQTASGPVSLLTTHLQAPYNKDTEHRYVPHRTAQLVQLSLRARRRREPLLALGDFNFKI